MIGFSRLVCSKDYYRNLVILSQPCSNPTVTCERKKTIYKVEASYMVLRGIFVY